MNHNVAIYCGWCRTATPAITQDIEPKTMLAILYRHIYNCDHYVAFGETVFSRKGDEGDDGSFFFICKPDPNGVYGTRVDL